MVNRLTDAFKAVAADQQKLAQAQPKASATATKEAPKDKKRISDFVKELSSDIGSLEHQIGKDISAYSKSQIANVTDINLDSSGAKITAKYTDGENPELNLKINGNKEKGLDLNLDLNYKDKTLQALKPFIEMLPADKQGLVKGALDVVLSMGLVQMISSFAAMFSNPFGSLANFNPLAAKDTSTPPVDLKQFFESDMAKSFMNSDMGKQLKGLVEEAGKIKEKAGEGMKQASPTGNSKPNLN